MEGETETEETIGEREREQMERERGELKTQIHYNQEF